MVIGASVAAASLALVAVALASFVCVIPGPRRVYSDAKTIVAAADLYRTEIEYPGCPTTDDLAREKIIDKTQRVTDTWGNRLEIICTEGDVWVESAGPDAIRHTEDDVDFRQPPPRRGWGSPR